jgi:hypothetical protein
MGFRSQFALHQTLAADVRYGSKGDMNRSNRDVRFTPKADIAEGDSHVRFVP